ncbi:MAG: hypothetical protein ACRENL_11885 [Candidatus Dormibacteria bacterium]
MRIGIRKLLLLGGSAAVLSTAGFAYMATNTVTPSNAGVGSGVVSGYSVDVLSYGNDPAGCYDGSNAYCTGSQDLATATSVTVKLTTQSPGQNVAPTTVYAYAIGPGTQMHVGHSNQCTPANTWNTSTGTGEFTCVFNPGLAKDLLDHVAIDASQ